MKIKIALIDNDELYLHRFVASFNSKYFDKITIYSFNSLELAQSNMQANKYDIVIASEKYDLSCFESKCVVAYFANSNDISVINNKKAIGKYQRVESIYKQILDLYSEVHTSLVYNDNDFETGTKLIGVFSASGGAGATSLASAYAMFLASTGESVLYLNLERNNCNIVFKGDGQLTFADVIYAVKSQSANVDIKLESCVKHDFSGVYFYEPCPTILDFLELNDDEVIEILKILKAKGKYKYIVIDFNFDFMPLSFKLMRLMYKTFVISLGNEMSVHKLRNLYKAMALKEEQENFPYLERMFLIYNRFSNKNSTTADDIENNLAGGVPDFGEIPFDQLVRHLMSLGMFSNECFK